MRKLIPFILIIIILITFSTVQLRGDSWKFFGNFGIMTDDSFTFTDYMWYFGANIDFSFNKLIMLSPEINAITYKFNFEAFFIEPAVLLNIKLGTFFAGGGLTKMLLISGSYQGSSDFALKLNAGFRSNHMRFRVFLITPFNDLLQDNLVGPTTFKQFRIKVDGVAIVMDKDRWLDIGILDQLKNGHHRLGWHEL